MSDLHAFQRDLLLTVAGNPGMKGLRLKQILENDLYQEVQHGRLYVNLDELVDRGLVEKREQDGRTNAYHVTDDGIDVIRERREWEAKQLTREGEA